jgi:hypothetical protein
VESSEGAYRDSGAGEAASPSFVALVFAYRSLFKTIGMRGILQ